MKTIERWRAAGAAAAGLALLLLPRAAAAQDGPGVLRTALDRYESRLEGVETVTIVRETEMPVGGPATSEDRLVRRTVDGRTTLVPADDSVASDAPVASVYARFDELAEHANLRGRSTVDGHDVYVVHLARLEKVDLGGSLSSGGGDGFTADSATAYVDSDRYLVRRAEMHGRMSMGGTQRPVSVDVSMRDFRDVDGFVYPYVTEARVRVEGIGPQMRAMMEKIQESSGDSVQQSLTQQLAAAVSGDGLRVVTRVQEVRVNAAGPGDRD